MDTKKERRKHSREREKKTNRIERRMACQAKLHFARKTTSLLKWAKREFDGGYGVYTLLREETV